MNDSDNEDIGEGEVVYSLERLAEAKANLERLEERDSLDTSGNVDKYHTRINRARKEVDFITERLKQVGLLAYSEAEIQGMEIDVKFPNSRSKDIVEHNGHNYQLRFTPNTKSRSGKTVTSWNRGWRRLP